MVQMVGNYQHEKNENLDEYFKAVGVPYIPRKMMQTSSPRMEIACNEEGEWTITTYSLLRTVVVKFKLGDEYEEHMPGGVTIKNVTTVENDTLVTILTAPDGSKSTRTYIFDDTHCTIVLRHIPSGQEAKRYFKRM